MAYKDSDQNFGTD